MRKLVEKFIISWVSRHNMYAVVYLDQATGQNKVYSISLDEDSAKSTQNVIVKTYKERAAIFPIHFDKPFKY